MGKMRGRKELGTFPKITSLGKCAAPSGGVSREPTRSRVELFELILDSEVGNKSRFLGIETSIKNWSTRQWELWFTCFASADLVSVCTWNSVSFPQLSMYRELFWCVDSSAKYIFAYAFKVWWFWSRRRKRNKKHMKPSLSRFSTDVFDFWYLLPNIWISEGDL